MEYFTAGIIVAFIIGVYLISKHNLGNGGVELDNVIAKRDEEKLAKKEKEVQDAKKKFDDAVAKFESNYGTKGGDKGS